MKKKLFKIANILIGLALIFLLVSRLDRGSLWDAFLGMNYGYFFIALVLMFLVQLIQAYRLFILVEGYEVTLRQIFWVYLVSLFLNNFLPGGIGGDSLKIYFLNKAERKLGKAVTLTLVDRLVGLFSLTVFIVIFFLFEWSYLEQFLALFGRLLRNYGFLVLALFIGLLLGLFLFKNLLKPFWTKLSKFLNDSKLALMGIRKELFLKISLLAVLAHLVRGAAFILVLWGLGNEGISFLEMMFIIAMAAWAVILPISIGGLGVREGLFSSLAFKFGVPLTTAIALSILTRFLLWIMALIGGIYLFFNRASFLPPSEGEEASPR